MASSSSPPETPPTTSNDGDNLELNKDLERMIEDVENMSVQLTWMAYDMVALRTNPDLLASMQKLNDASQKCKATVLGEQQQEMK